MATPMDSLRADLSKVRIPEPTNRIFKSESCISFDTRKSEGGLYVDMQTFLAFGKECASWHPVYLHIKQTKKDVPEDRPLKKPTLFAVLMEGLIIMNLNTKSSTM